MLYQYLENLKVKQFYIYACLKFHSMFATFALNYPIKFLIVKVLLCLRYQMIKLISVGFISMSYFLNLDF